MIYGRPELVTLRLSLDAAWLVHGVYYKLECVQHIIHYAFD